MYRFVTRSAFSFIFILILIGGVLLLSGLQTNITTVDFTVMHTNKEKLIIRNSLDNVSLLATNDWIINDFTLVENKSLLVSENILILDEGVLYLNNSEINMYSSNGDKLRIEVFSGGELIIFNSNITDILKSNSYYIKANKGSRLFMNGARISYAGFSSGFEHDTSGLWINTDNVIVKDSHFTNNYYGVYVEASKNVSMYNCYISSSYEGIGLNSVYNSSVSSTVISNNFDHGIIIDSSKGIAFENLTIFENDVVVNSNNSTDLIFYDSSIHDNHGATYFINVHKVQFHNNTVFSNADGIYFYTSSDIMIENNSISKNDGFAIYLLTSANSTIQNNIVSHNEHGISLFNATNLNIKANLLEDDGIWLANYTREQFATIVFDNSNKVNGKSVSVYFNVSDIIIIQDVLGELIFAFCDNLTVINNKFSGAELYQSTNIGIISNNVSDMDYGIYLRAVANVSILNNTITNCYIGNYITKSRNITIWNNTISFSDKYGIFLRSSSNTTAYYNEFIENAIQVLDDSAVFWDNGTVGNYWSDYTGIDANVDGIGDMPYKIDSDSEDRFPIVYPDLIQPAIYNVTHEPQTPNELNSVVINAKVVDKGGLAQVILSYHNGKAWYNSSMEYNTTKMTYEGTIPPHENGTEILYRIYATDYAGNWNASPIYSYIIQYHETNPPVIVNIIQEPKNPTDLDSVLVKANISDESDIVYAILSYSVCNEWYNITMIYEVSSKFYEGRIPKMSVGFNISYKIYAIDEYNNTSVSDTQNYTILSHDTESPIINEIFQFPQNPTDRDNVLVSVNITDESEILIAILSYTNGSIWYNLTMSKNETNFLFQGMIPKSLSGVTIQYFVYAEDAFGNAIISKTCSYSVIASDTTGPIIKTVFHIPEKPTDQDIVTVFVNVTDDSGVSNVFLSYYNGSLWTNISMDYNDTLGFYLSRIPKMPSNLTISFKIYANDSFGNWVESETFTYVVSTLRIYNPKLIIALIISAVFASFSLLAIALKVLSASKISMFEKRNAKQKY